MVTAIDAALIAFWAASLVMVALRRVSDRVAQVSQYGGRTVQQHGATSTGHGVGGWRRWSLFHVLVSRRLAFTAFYAVGIVTCIALAMVHMGPWYPSIRRGDLAALLPLILFGLHCCVRCVETVYRQQFRSHGDAVTVFAMASGCGFYGIASMSAVPWSALTVLRSADDTAPFQQDWRFLLVPALTAAVHLFFQGLQVWHHEILRSMRIERRSPRGTKRMRPKKLKEASYQYPSGLGLFSFVQEPHYMCEVALYLVQWLYMVAASGVEGYHWPALLVAVFTCANLFVTASDHTAYWRSAPDHAALPRWKILPLLM